MLTKSKNLVKNRNLQICLKTPDPEEEKQQLLENRDRSREIV